MRSRCHPNPIRKRAGKLRPTCASLLVLLLAGCSSYVARVDPTKSLAGYHHYFVKSNFDDNHGIDARIARELQERGFTVENGPLTMMPPKAQAIVSFEDHWNWDFTNHLSGLNLYVRDAKSEAVVASAFYSGPTSLTSSIDDVIDKLVTKLLAKGNKPPAHKS